MQYLIKYGITKYFESVSYTWRGTEIVYIKFVLKCLKYMLVFIFFIFAPWPFSIKSTLVKNVPSVWFIFAFSNYFFFFSFFQKHLPAQSSWQKWLCMFLSWYILDAFIQCDMHEAESSTDVQLNDFAQKPMVTLTVLAFALGPSWSLEQNLSQCAD